MEDEDGRLVAIQGTIRDVSERARTKRLLEALNDAAVAMEGALTAREIFTAAAGELKRVGYECAVLLLSEDGRALRLEHVSYGQALIERLEETLGISLLDSSVTVGGTDFWTVVAGEQRTVLLEDVKAHLRQVLPRVLRPFAGHIVRLLGFSRVIDAPLKVGEEVVGLLSVQSSELSESDVPHVTAFAHQMAASWRKTQLLDEARREIAERKRAQQELRASQQRFDSFMSHMPGAVFVKDCQGRVVYANEPFARAAGCEADELVGRTTENMVPPDVHARYVEENQRALKGETVVSESVTRGPQGERHWLTYKSPIHREGEPTLVGSVSLDVTDRKRAEEALRASEEKYRLLVENANEGVAVGQDGLLKFVNPKVKELSGYSMEELRTTRFAELIHPDDRAMVMDRHRRRLWGEELTRVYPFRIVDKEGATRWVEVNAVRITWEGRPATLNLFTDITERRRAREALRRRNRELSALTAIAGAVGRSLDLGEVLDAALEETLKALDAGGGLIYLYDEASEAFAPIIHRGISADVIRELRTFKMGEGLSGHVAQSGQPLVTHLATDARNISSGSVKDGWRSYAGVPIRSMGKVLWVMSLISREAVKFRQEHLGVLSHIGGQVGLAIENANLYETVQRELADRKRAQEALQKSEERYRTIFQTAAVPIWQEDFSRVREAQAELESQGVTGFRRYFREHPEFVERAARMIQVRDVNDAALRMLGAETKEVVAA